MVSAIPLRFLTVQMIIVHGDYVRINQYSVIHEQKLEHCYSTAVILLSQIFCFYFRTDSMAFESQPVPSNHPIDSIRVISLFPTLIASFLFTLIHLMKLQCLFFPTYIYKDDNIACVTLWRRCLHFFMLRHLS